MINKIKEHRSKMNFSNTRFAITSKTVEELDELTQEIQLGTNGNALKKEIGDVAIMLVPLCELHGYTLEEAVDYAIKMNERK